MQSPLVSIVIVNWNGMQFIKNCLDSIYAQNYPSLEVIVVDNGSTDGSVKFLKEKFPQVKLVEQSENTGFATANNRGIESAKGKYILTLNNDTVLKENFLKILLNTAKNSGEKIGMWAPKILSINEPGIIDSVGGLLIYKDTIARGRGRGERDTGQYDTPCDILIPSACSALYRKEMLDEIGGFDEDFFAYCEDTDLGLRARLCGWGARSVPAATTLHHYSGTTGKYSPTKVFLVERNRVWVAVKNLPTGWLLLSPFYSFRRYMAQLSSLITGTGAGGKFKEQSPGASLVSIVLRAYFSALIKLPSMLLKRGGIQNRRKISPSELKELFAANRLSAKELASKD